MKLVNPTLALCTYVARFANQRQAARALGISEPYLSDLLRNRRTASERILKKLRLRRVVVASR